MKIGLIGEGAIGRYVAAQLSSRGHPLVQVLVRGQRLSESATSPLGAPRVSSVADLATDIDHMIDCAGHGALVDYGADILRRGLSLTTVSIGALADAELRSSLATAATAGGATLHLASGAIGALDALRAGRVGELRSVTYTGRKPPAGWRGSPAEETLDLDTPMAEAQLHFEGPAGEAATRYPKNANVAAAVALAGIGFEKTQVRLIADPTIDANIHQVEAFGDFGSLAFEIRGTALPDNPRSSALAAMSVVSQLDDLTQPVRF